MNVKFYDRSLILLATYFLLSEFLPYWWETNRPQENFVIWDTKHKLSGNYNKYLFRRPNTFFSEMSLCWNNRSILNKASKTTSLKVWVITFYCSFLLTRYIWKHSKKCKELCNIRCYYYYLNINAKCTPFACGSVQWALLIWENYFLKRLW